MLAQLSRLLQELGLPHDALDGWKCTVAQRNGVDVAMVLTRGTEIHLASLTERKAISRKNVREFLAPILAEHGVVTTRVPLDVTDHKLRTALGFTQTWADERYTYWALTELPFNKANA
jgi:hypothetical protein